MQDITQIHSLQAIRIHGEDAASFLQGQLTTDVTQVQNTWQLAGYCSPKGRLLAAMYLSQNQNGFLAVLHNSIAASVSQRLRMYVLRSKVVIEPVAASFHYLSSFSGKFAEIGENNGCPVLSFGDFGLRVAIQENPAGDNADAPLSQADLDWELALIQAGIPSITSLTQELFVPQMVNLDALGGINFKKGCYTGQEIVARMHYLGKLKQRMFVCSVSGESGDEVASKIITQDGKNAGTLASQIISGSCLAVLRIEHCQSRLQLESGAPIQVNAEQPYSLKTSKQSEESA